MSFLNVTGISKNKDGRPIVNDIRFIQNRFQKIAIAGETGSGKSTLLKMIAGHVQPDAGYVFFKEERILGPEEKLIPGHPGIAYLSQHFELRNNYRVEEILEMANKLPEADADEIFDVCQIHHLFKRRTDQLSGGEKQRIAAARLLIGSPSLLLLDEPYSNLDLAHKNTMKQVIRDIGERLQLTCILISHDPADTLSWADEILIMKDGKIIQQGSPSIVYHQPIDEYTGALLGNYMLIPTLQSIQSLGIIPEKKPGENLFLRPEYFSLTTNENSTLKGTVLKVNFSGNHSTINVYINGLSIPVATNNISYMPGETVYLTLDRKALWYL